MINTVHVGMDPLGQKVLSYAMEHNCFSIIGAVDLDPEKDGRGFVGDWEVITLTFRAAVGERESHDQVHIDGEPPIQSRIAGGVNGDIATCAITLNAVRSILQTSPGLKTMGQIPPIAFSK